MTVKPTMPRRKYQFTDRATAEEAYREKVEEVGLHHVALHVLVNGKADWKGSYGDYRCQVLGASRADGGCVMVTYAPRSQTAYTTCYSPEGIRVWLRALIASSAEEERNVRELLRRALDAIAVAQGGAS